MTDTPRSDIMDRDETAAFLRCSTGHVSNLMNGKVPTKTPFPTFNVGRRKYTRRSWVMQWTESERSAPR